MNSFLQLARSRTKLEHILQHLELILELAKFIQHSLDQLIFLGSLLPSLDHTEMILFGNIHLKIKATESRCNRPRARVAPVYNIKLNKY